MDETGELIVRVTADGSARGRTGSARAAIVAAATELFLARGYQATGTDQIATAAAVSKQTVYNQFGDKASLFSAIVLGVTATAEAFAGEVTELLDGVHDEHDLEAVLERLGRRQFRAALHPSVLAVRRLVVGEATRFPQLAARYHDLAPAATMRALAEGFAGLSARGLLRAEDPARAAADFAFVLLGEPLDRGMFHLDTPAPPDAEVERRVVHAVRVFRTLYI